MHKKALYALSYGVFMLSSKSGDKTNGCITNTCIQVANNPTRIAISVLNSNYTCELIRESGIFALSILNQECTYETIQYFGYQSGRNVDKTDALSLPKECQGIPYLGWHTSAVISGKVVDAIDLGTHTLFIAEVVDAKQINNQPPLTYADYQGKIKPSPQQPKESSDRRIIAWRCKICNYVYEGSTLPEDFSCPLCGHGSEDFEPIYE